MQRVLLAVKLMVIAMEKPAKRLSLVLAQRERWIQIIHDNIRRLGPSHPDLFRPVQLFVEKLRHIYICG